ncbi:class I SAM-dependent methyltransferase [Rhodococcus xishaensis]|uniref:Class I SAM-dependent methyltransferase n=1 Tax=Rhodococcus xishaensis TaxID=2487364 RepID=A0A3S3AGT3_9NOCA|nr:class I SAM-dependent methyltransferase [Rhodococcus xishaensis]RVW00147.1 class I SAM-dependent methyltransferase [Rhodococcus xishaensis]
MSWRHAVFDTIYRLGRPMWDTPPPEQLRDAVEGEDALPPGHALDVGCGTGTNVIYLAKHGWRATGVDFSATAIQRARRAADGIAGAAFLEGDATELSQLDIGKPIDLVLDMGCYHSLPDAAKPVYVAELAAVTEAGTPLMMWETLRIKPDKISDAFSRDFTVERFERKDFILERLMLRRAIAGTWYWLRRR